MRGRDPRIQELQEALRPLGNVRISEGSDEVSVVVPKPIDIAAVDNALMNVLVTEPLDRFERADSWRIRLMKREQRRPSGIQYEAVKILDSYYEYRPQLPDPK